MNDKIIMGVFQIIKWFLVIIAVLFFLAFKEHEIRRLSVFIAMAAIGIEIFTIVALFKEG